MTRRKYRPTGKILQSCNRIFWLMLVVPPLCRCVVKWVLVRGKWVVRWNIKPLFCQEEADYNDDDIRWLCIERDIVYIHHRHSGMVYSYMQIPFSFSHSVSRLECMYTKLNIWLWFQIFVGYVLLLLLDQLFGARINTLIIIFVLCSCCCFYSVSDLFLSDMVLSIDFYFIIFGIGWIFFFFFCKRYSASAFRGWGCRRTEVNY